jgi:hypothetical protein
MGKGRDPLRGMNQMRDRLVEIAGYVSRILDLAGNVLRENWLLAHEMSRGAPQQRGAMEGPLKSHVNQG